MPWADTICWHYLSAQGLDGETGAGKDLNGIITALVCRIHGIGDVVESSLQLDEFQFI